jgi:hypothetical protein
MNPTPNAARTSPCARRWTRPTAIEPFFDPANAWNGQQLEHLAYRLIRENLPQLPPADVQAIVTAATRIYRSRHPAGQ